MTALIHLNGPPGIGKSTLAARYADRHPGTLNLDIDTLHHLIGGWRTSQGQFHDLLRPLAWAMAGTHLAGGRDVILPQYVGDLQQLQIFERVAHDAEADFIEIVPDTTPSWPASDTSRANCHDDTAMPMPP